MSNSNKNILIIDDVVDNLKVLSEYLLSHGYRVRPVTSGEIALKTIETKIPDLILLDIKMPVMDGYECAKLLKALFKENPAVKCLIIACTAGVQSSERKKALDSGMDQFCAKPITRPMIKEFIDNYLSHNHKINFSDRSNS